LRRGLISGGGRRGTDWNDRRVKTRVEAGAKTRLDARDYRGLVDAPGRPEESGEGAIAGNAGGTCRAGGDMRLDAFVPGRRNLAVDPS
jgi:hypothetical protein